jgi:hypothetical protein
MKKNNLCLILILMLFTINSVWGYSDSDLLNVYTFDTDSYEGTVATDAMGNSLGITKSSTDLISQSGGIRGEYHALRATAIAYQPQNHSAGKTNSYWFRASSTGQYMYVFAYTSGSNYALMGYDSRELETKGTGDGTCYIMRYDNYLGHIDGDWHLIMITNATTYVDGVALTTTWNTTTTCGTGVTSLTNAGGFGGWGPPSYDESNFDIDEYYVWDKFFTADDALDYYNSELFYPYDLIMDGIELKRNNIQSVNFTFNITSSKEAYNCSLIQNLTVFDSILNAAPNTTYTLSTTNVSVGMNLFDIKCEDFESENTLAVRYDYDNSTPFIQPLNPSFYNITKIVGSEELNLRINISDGDLDKINYSIYDPNNTLIWNSYIENINDSSYYLNEIISLVNESDGDYIIHVEATDEQQIQDIGGLNPSELYYQFEIDNCQPNWNCTEYSECSVFNYLVCSEAEDLNSCGENVSNYFSIQPLECVYVAPSGGSSSIFPPTTAPDQLNIPTQFTTIPGKTSTTFSIADLDVKMPQIFKDFVEWFENLEWNSEVFE